MALTLTDEIKKLLDRPNFAHLATLMPDGSPQSAPVWVAREGDRILIATGEGLLKAKNTRRDPRAAPSILDMDDPDTEATLRCRVVERRPAREAMAGPGEALLRVRRVGICGTDLHIYQGHLDHRVPRGGIIGHETFAEVVEAPPDGGFARGDRVVVEPVLSCGACRACRMGA